MASECTMLNEDHAIQLRQFGPEGRGLELLIGGVPKEIPACDAWFGGVEVYDGRDWRVAELCVSTTDPAPDSRSPSLPLVGAAPFLRVRIDGYYREVDARQLRYWPARNVRTDSGAVEEADDRAALASKGEDQTSIAPGTVVESSHSAERERVPALPPGWIAERLLGVEESSTRWQASSLHFGPPVEMEDFELSPEMSARLSGDLERLLAAPHECLARIENVWRRPGGVIVARPLQYGALGVADALSEGSLAADRIFEAFLSAATAIDHLSSIGVSAHRQVTLANLHWQGDCACLQRSCCPDVVELGGPQGAVGYLSPERLNAVPASAASDQFALAIAYVEARTGCNPLLPNDWAVITGVKEVPLSGMYPVETAVVRRALARSPEERWPSARAFVEQLALAVGVTVVGSAEPSRKIEPDSTLSDDRGGIGSELSIEEYRRLFSGVPRPNSQQIDAFVEHVAGKHSWYKHLPMTPPGVRFHVFLDPGAGMQRFETPDGRVSFQEIGPDAKLFHYAMMPTQEYRRRFGLLNVLDRGAPSFAVYSSAGKEHFDTGPGVLVNGALVPIPTQVAFVGSVMVTSALHDRSGEPFLWERHFDGRGWASQEEAATSRWPEESGGPAVIDALRRLYEDPAHSLYHYRPVIERLVSPERERQRRCIREQIERLIAFVYDEFPWGLREKHAI